MDNTPKTPYELFGIECGDGWKPLYEPIMKYIEEYNSNKENEEEKIKVFQIKEKYGGLRFYTNFGNKELFDMIDDAEEKSFHTCERCGAPCESRSHHGWIYTLCDDCFNAMVQKRKEEHEKFLKKMEEERKGAKK